MRRYQENETQRPKGEFFGSWPLVFLLLTIILILICIVQFKEKFPQKDLFLNVFSGVISNLIWTVLLIAILGAVNALVTLRQRRVTIAFFGLKNPDSKLTIFLSNIQVQKNGTYALEEVSPGYYGCAVSRLEYQSAHAIRAIITSRPLNPISSGAAEDWVGKINQRFGRTEVDIRVSPIPQDAEPRVKNPIGSLHVSGGAEFRRANHNKDTISENNVKDADLEVIVDASEYSSGQNEEKKIVAISATNGIKLIAENTKTGRIETSEDTPKKSMYYRWDEDIKDKTAFWSSELKECGSIVIIGSDIYNSVARYYFDNYYQENKLKYRYFAIFETHLDDDLRRVVIREKDGQKAPDGKWEGKIFLSNTQSEPAIIMRLYENSKNNKSDKSRAGRTVILCAGLSHVATASAARYLCNKWRDLEAEFEGKEFAVVLECKKRKDGINDIRDLDPGVFVEWYDLQTTKEPGSDT